MTRILVIGDTHIKINGMDRCGRMIELILEEAIRVSPDFLVLLGDSLDRFANLRIEALDLCIDFFKKLKDICDTYVLIGNHDRVDNAVFCDTCHAFNSVKLWSKTPHTITIVDYPILRTIDKVQYGFIPYVPNSRYAEALSLIPGWENSLILFSHQDFYQAKYGHEFSTTGDHWNEDNPTVISGHIHEEQKLYNGKVYYPGSPMQHSYSEDSNKQILHVHVNNKEKTFTYESIKMFTPVYWTFKIKYDDISTYKIPKMPQYSDMKLQVEGTVAELKGLFKQSKIKEWISQGIKIQSVVKQDTKIKPQDF